MIGGAPSFGEGALAGINTLNPFKGMMGGKTAAPAMFGVDGGTRTFTNVQDAKAYQSLFPDAKITELPAAEQPKDYLASGLQAMQGPKGTSVLGPFIWIRCCCCKLQSNWRGSGCRLYHSSCNGCRSNGCC